MAHDPQHPHGFRHGRRRPHQDPPRFTQKPTHPGSKYQDFPTGPGKPPYRAKLEDLVEHLPDIRNRMVFHICGDTGGVKHPESQQIVADAMEHDSEKSDSASKPAFFYHLGDVVYYNGETKEYYPQFYLPYEFYQPPILSIPGNHDGDPALLHNGHPKEPSLSAWHNNFCSKTGDKTHQSQDVPRPAMKQPNPYWTLLTPLATFIGLYTNVPEGGQVRDEQKKWFIEELSAADRSKAIFVCMHHPVFSGDSHHSGSPHMKELLDEAVKEAKIHPDIVFAGHVHNYQRFTRKAGEGKDHREYPYIVAGAGGYWHLHTMAKFQGAKVTTPFRQAKTDTSGVALHGSTEADADAVLDENVVLEKYVDDRHGFMRVEIEKDVITCRYFAVRKSHEPHDTPPRVADSFQLRFQSNREKNRLVR